VSTYPGSDNTKNSPNSKRETGAGASFSYYISPRNLFGIPRDIRESRSSPAPPSYFRSGRGSENSRPGGIQPPLSLSLSLSHPVCVLLQIEVKVSGTRPGISPRPLHSGGRTSIRFLARTREYFNGIERERERERSFRTTRITFFAEAPSSKQERTRSEQNLRLDDDTIETTELCIQLTQGFHRGKCLNT